MGQSRRETGSAFQAVDDGRGVAGFYFLIKHSRTGGDERAFGTEAHAAHAFHLAVVFGAAALDILIESIFDRLALAGKASGGDAYIDALGELALSLAFGFGDLIEFLGRHACVHFLRCSRMAEVATFPATSWS